MVMFLALHPMEASKGANFRNRYNQVPHLTKDTKESYISQLIRFARASSYVASLNTRNKLLTEKLLKQGHRYHKLRKTFSKFYRRYYDLISKFQVGLKSLLRQGISEAELYGDLVYKLTKDCWLSYFFQCSLLK